MKVFALRCKVTKTFNRCFEAEDDGAAKQLVMRTLMEAGDSMVASCVEQYSLFSVGFMDSEKGLIKTTPKLVTDLIDIPNIVDVCKTGIQRMKTIFESEVQPDGQKDV